MAPSRYRAGISLPYTLLSLAMVGVILLASQRAELSASLAFRTETSAAQRAADRQTSLALAGALIQQANRTGQYGLLLDGYDLGSGRMIVVRDVRGLVDINTADAEVIGQLFSRSATDALLNARIDRRFETVDALLRDRIVDPDAYAMAQEHLTVFSGQVGLWAPGMSEGLADRIQIYPRSDPSRRIYRVELWENDIVVLSTTIAAVSPASAEYRILAIE